MATLVNHHVLQAYVFRNYCLKANSKNVYMGSSKHKLWQAIRASTAAPGYFEEFLLDGDMFQVSDIWTNKQTTHFCYYEASECSHNQECRMKLVMKLISQAGMRLCTSMEFLTNIIAHVMSVQ